jgi:2-polyprenyl-6-methoxyphenol hydroxylase-like FAD-dependent oxidoreductase
LEVDVAVCGGTLGLLLACTLQLKGHRVVVLEAGPLRGRAQDWNTSEEELQTLITMGCLTQDELQLVAPFSFGPMSCRFGPSPTFDLQLQGVLDVAVSPTALLECVRRRFEAAGGLVLERTLVTEVRIYADGAELALEGPDEGGASRILHSHLVVDCMGHRSPIALQQRDGQRPDGVCVQVGSCVRGAWATQRRAGDFFVTHTDAQRAGPQCNARVQYFWQVLSPRFPSHPLGARPFPSLPFSSLPFPSLTFSSLPICSLPVCTDGPLKGRSVPVSSR